MNNNNNHKICGFAEDAAAYLYGEIGKREKVNFETHLAKCNSCAEEIAGFASLREGIADWKMKSFDALATPIIEIPYEKHAPTVEIRTEKISWFDSLKNSLTFSPAMAMIAATIILALFGGISYLVLNSNGEELASNQTVTNEFISSPVIADKKPDSEVKEDEKSNNFTAPEVAENTPDKTDNKNGSVPTIINTKVPEKRQNVTVAEEKPKNIKIVVPNRKSDKVKNIEETSPVQAVQKMPKLNTLPDNEELNELSLSDLLADVDAK
jgi:hypothetical protein